MLLYKPTANVMRNDPLGSKTTEQISVQVLSSSWDGRPFGHNSHGPKIGGLCPYGGAGSPCNTMWPGPRPTFVPSGISIHPAIWPQQTWRKLGGLPLRGWSWVRIKHNVAWVEACLRTKWHLDPSSCLATINMGQKVNNTRVISCVFITLLCNNYFPPENYYS